LLDLGGDSFGQNSWEKRRIKYGSMGMDHDISGDSID
jgi:hypothetical protein